MKYGPNSWGGYIGYPETIIAKVLVGLAAPEIDSDLLYFEAYVEILGEVELAEPRLAGAVTITGFGSGVKVAPVNLSLLVQLKAAFSAPSPPSEKPGDVWIYGSAYVLVQSHLLRPLV